MKTHPICMISASRAPKGQRKFPLMESFLVISLCWRRNLLVHLGHSFLVVPGCCWSTPQSSPQPWVNLTLRPCLTRSEFWCFLACGALWLPWFSRTSLDCLWVLVCLYTRDCILFRMPGSDFRLPIFTYFPEASKWNSLEKPSCSTRVGLPWWTSLGAQTVKCLPTVWERPRFDSAVRKILWRRKRHHTPVLLPGKSHGRRSMIGYSPWGCKESDTTERLHFHFLLEY